MHFNPEAVLGRQMGCERIARGPIRCLDRIERSSAVGSCARYTRITLNGRVVQWRCERVRNLD